MLMMSHMCTFPPQTDPFRGLGPGQPLERRPAGEGEPHPDDGAQHLQEVPPEARRAVHPDVCCVRSQPAGVAVRAVRRHADLRRPDGIREA